MHEPTDQNQRPDAVVWIDERHAVVAQRDPAGGISTVEIRRAGQNEVRYLGHIVHEIGAHDHVMIIGTQPIRLALERRFVAVCHRPDRLAAVPKGIAVDDRILAGMDRVAA